MVGTQTPAEQALAIARERGIARARDFEAAGIPRTYLRRLCDQGKLVKLERGLYQSADFAQFHAAHDLAQAARLVPSGVICLLSALRFHGLTTQLPHAVWIMIEHKARSPQITAFPCEIARASGAAFSQGRMSVSVENVDVIITTPAKTVADCFKYRRRIGIDVAVEALKDTLAQRKANRSEIWQYAGICRVRPLIKPYLEALA